MAAFSFTLYVVHMPLLTLLTSLTAHDARWQPGVGTMAAALGCLLLTLGYAWLIASCTEFHTNGVRRWLERRLFGAARPLSPPGLPVGKR